MRNKSAVIVVVIFLVIAIGIVAFFGQPQFSKGISVVPISPASNTPSVTGSPTTPAPVTTSNQPPQSQAPAPVTLPNRSITIDGTLVCLPHLKTKGAQTMECAYGLRDNKGVYYSLSDTNPEYKNISQYPMNTYVEAIGTISYQKSTVYQSVGIIAVSSLFPVTNNTDVNVATKGTLGFGETKTINGISVTFNSITQDNRCPIDVNCIVAGHVIANVTLRNSSIYQTIDIASDASSYDFLGYKVSITGVTPLAVSNETIPASKYRLTVAVKQ